MSPGSINNQSRSAAPFIGVLFVRFGGSLACPLNNQAAAVSGRQSLPLRQRVARVLSPRDAAPSRRGNVALCFDSVAAVVSAGGVHPREQPRRARLSTFRQDIHTHPPGASPGPATTGRDRWATQRLTRGSACRCQTAHHKEPLVQTHA